MRVTQLIDEGFSKHIVRLAAETECHSDDDEPALGSDEYMIHAKEGRDSLVTDLFRIMSMRHERAKSHQRKKGRRYVQFADTSSICSFLSLRVHRTRTPGLGPSEISLPLPQKVPIDFFSPDFFNSLSVRQRKIYMGNGVALPTAEFCQKWEDIENWKGLSKAEFMDRYGRAKLALYKLPTAAEIARLEEFTNDEDDD